MSTQIWIFCPTRLLFVLFLAVVWRQEFASAEESNDKESNAKERELYEYCGNGKKVCYGENNNCVHQRSCAHLVTIIDLGQRYNISFLDKCHHDLDEPIFSAAAVATFNHKRELDCSKDLSVKDFKVFIFWKGAENCNKTSTSVSEYGLKKDDYKFLCEKKVKDNSGSTIKNTLDSTSGMDLNAYLNHFVLFSRLSGDWSEASRPFNFTKDMNYTVSHDKVFYSSSTTRGEATHENSSSGLSTWIFSLPLFAFVVFNTSFHFTCRYSTL